MTVRCYGLRRKALLLLSLPPVAPSPFPNRDGGIDHDLRLIAMEALLEAAKLEPNCWSIWLKLATCIDGPEEVTSALRCSAREIS